MPTDVVMPQMGESIFEGTITKWLKKPGDKVQRDEPLFEISTDKVDAEIPAPASGVLKEVKIAEGATVQVNTVVAVIDAEGSAAAAPAAKPAPAPPAKTTDGDGPQGKPAAKTEEKSAPKQPPAAEPAPAVQASSSNGGAGIDVVMPQMGESIFEGTITKWLKKVGDKVSRDEPLFEISTDKVDAEIPAPASGVLKEIKVAEGSTVQVNTVVAVIGGAGAAAAQSPAAQPAAKPAAPVAAAAPAAKVPPRPEIVAAPVAVGQQGERVRSSPLVRRIARENNVDLSSVPATGLGGRISKNDILEFVQKHGAGGPVPVQRGPIAVQPEARSQAAPAPRAAAAPVLHQLADELVPMTPMRKKIAERMVESRRTSAHVHTIFKVDMTRIVKLREKTRKQ